VRYEIAIAATQTVCSIAVVTPNTAWVSDITYIKTYEGFTYRAVVIGRATQSRQPTDAFLA